MAAGIEIVRYTGTSPGTPTIITGLNTRANAEDSAVSTTTNPVQIPAASTNYSYWVSTRLSCPTTLPVTQVSNVRWYTDGTNNFGTGIGCIASEASTYKQATGTLGQSGDQLNSSNYPSGLVGAIENNVFLITSAVPKFLTGILLSSSGTGPFGNFLVYQITVGLSAAPGVTGQETFFWKYDET